LKAIDYPAAKVFLFLLAISIMIVGVAAAGEKTDPPHDKQLDLIRQLHGTNMTTGEFMAIVFPEELETLRLQMSKNDFKEFCNQKKYWGDDYPSLPYGANIWTENGPLNLSALNKTEKERYGIRDAIIGGNGYLILDYLKWHIREGESVSFHRNVPEGTGNLTCDLNWIDTGSSLKVTLFAPDGMMGPYDDDSDGYKDGRVFLQFSRERDLTGGDWYVVIESEKITREPQPFRLLFY